MTTNSGAFAHWGRNVQFIVSSQKMLTFRDLKISSGVEIATHSTLGGPDRTEILRPKLRTLTMDVILDLNMTGPPRKTLQKFERGMEAGWAYALVIGGERVGSYRWIITELSQAWEVIYSNGALTRATMTVTMHEYL